MRSVCYAVIAAALAGCATPSASIKGTPTDTSAYSSWSCEQLRAESIKRNNDLIPLASAQDKLRQSDTMGVILIGLPVGSMGDPGSKAREAEIARRKGELDAMARVIVAKKCPL